MDTKIIKKAIYNLCTQANTILSDEVIAKIQQTTPSLDLNLILLNAKMAYEKKMPLCQDTGQVIVFLKTPQNITFEGEFINSAINSGVEEAYKNNFYRKSVVKNALNRINTTTNTPCIIYTEFSKDENIEINLLLKGAGSENMSTLSMLSPTAKEKDIIEFISNVIKKSGTKACPPMFIGVGIGGTTDYASILSKKALFKGEKNSITKELEALENVADVKILTDFTHIACMPVAVTINCHSNRHASCKITEAGEIIYNNRYMIEKLTAPTSDFSDYKKINTSEIEVLKNLNVGDKILLSGEIYTARDAAHQKMLEEGLPFDIKNKIIFYAGPCPCPKNEIIGSVGPTTASRMDKFASQLYAKGLLATIGKGERSKDFKGLYFTLTGGIACFIAQKVTAKELIAYPELGTEAVYKLSVKDLPLNVNSI